MDGWYGHSALQFVLAPGETRYVAFDEDSEGAWSAAPGTKGVPRDQWGGYISTWGEFSFGDQENDGWSGWDVSAIQTQIAHGPVEGMRICMADGKGCSIITPGAERVVDAYTAAKRHHDGIGGAASPGPVRLTVDLDYKE
ncbi:Allergen Asp f 4 [Penicillium chermesinum]|nr:Allergen Asp f 4 [Penicillium chermesinum]